MTIEDLLQQAVNQQGEIVALLKDIRAALGGGTPNRTAGLIFDVLIEGKLLRGVTTLKITDTQQFIATISPVDAKGNPSQIDGSKTSFTTDNPQLLALTPAPDGLSCKIAALGPIGSAQVQASATDATVGTDVVHGVLQVDVVAGATASLQLNTSAPVEQSVPAGAP